MINPKLLRDNVELVAKELARRKFVLDIKKVTYQEKNRKFLQIKMETLQSQRNFLSKKIGKLKSTGQNFDYLYQKISVLNESLDDVKRHIHSLNTEIKDYALSLPNILDKQVPDGCSENNNIEIYRWGNPKCYNFKIRDHIKLGQMIGGLDFSTAVKISSSRFIVMHGQIASLHRALVQFMLDIHINQHGYQEYYVPYLVNKKSLYGTGQLPKFNKDLFYTKPLRNNDDGYVLIPTAEVPLINLLTNKIISRQDLPLKMVAHTPCFRSEVGNYGKDRRGLIRMHQFDKVELVQIVEPEQSTQILEEITGHAEKILQLLNLPYRKILLCTGVVGFSACKTYDLEVWLPAYEIYREISSCSNTGDFQARRIKARYRDQRDRNNYIKLVHTLNASGLAVGRTLVAVLENYQLSNGCVEIPYVLRKYMNGLEYIGNKI